MGSLERATIAHSGRPESERRRPGVAGAWIQADRSARFRSQSATDIGRGGHRRGTRARLSEESRMTRRKSGVIVPHSPRWYQRFAAWCVVACLRAVALTVRFKITDESGYFTKPNPGPAIYCLWHNRLALCAAVYERYVKPRNKTPGLAALVSASKDGA